MNLAAAIEERAHVRDRLDHPAFVVDGRVFSHRAVHDGAARTASLLSEMGVGPGDRVLVAVLDGIEFAWAFLAAVRLGAIAIPVNPRLSVDDHQYAVSHSGARAVFCPAGLASRFGGVREVVASETLEVTVAALSQLPPVRMGPDAPAYAQYTSGTTGAPKAAVHRHADPFVYFDAFAVAATDMGAEDVVLSVSKMFFAYGLGNSLFFPLLAGAQAVLNPGPPQPKEVAELASRHGVTLLFAVPTFYARLIGTARPEHFVTLRAAVSAGETLTTALAERTEQFLQCPVLDGLGSTEVGQTFVSNTLGTRRVGTVGRALPPYEVAVRDDAGDSEATAGEGTLWVRGPTLSSGYLGSPEATSAGQTGQTGEWLCTGDRATIDDNGFVHHRGRVDDLEMVGGISVAPTEIEQLLCHHSAVGEVAVAGVRDGDGASRLEAFVVLASPASLDVAEIEALKHELVAMARARLAPFKVPRVVYIVNALPRTPTGKLKRFVLRSGNWDRGPAPAE